MQSIVLRTLVCLACIFGAGLNVRAGDVHTLTDMGGRSVTIPKSSDCVLSRSPIGTVLMYTLNPAKIAGQNWQPTASEKKYLDQAFLSLPVLSGWYADGKVGNTEEIIKAGPDFILYSFFGPRPKPGVLDQAARIEKQLNIPVVLVKGDLKALPETYRFVAGIVGEEERGQVLSNYTAALLEDAGKKAAILGEQERVRVYYAEGPEGLQTDPAGSWHTAVLDYIGASNVAEVHSKTMMGRATVSPEQLLQWNPQMIIACHDQGFAAESATYQAIVKDPRFANLDAVRLGNVFEVPYQPFNFLDRPPSVNRLIGIKWLGNLFYPEVFRSDIRNDIKEFYALFYRIALSDAQLREILHQSQRRM